MDGAGSYSVAHRAGLLPTEHETGMCGCPHQGSGSPPAPAPTKQRPQVRITSGCAHHVHSLRSSWQSNPPDAEVQSALQSKRHLEKKVEALEAQVRELRSFNAEQIAGEIKGLYERLKAVYASLSSFYMVDVHKMLNASDREQVSRELSGPVQSLKEMRRQVLTLLHNYFPDDLRPKSPDSHSNRGVSPNPRALRSRSPDLSFLASPAHSHSSSSSRRSSRLT